jgi:hypothetical protein
MSDCLHCDIHELLDSQLEGKEANLAEIAAKVTEVLADIIFGSSGNRVDESNGKCGLKPHGYWVAGVS